MSPGSARAVRSAVLACLLGMLTLAGCGAPQPAASPAAHVAASPLPVRPLEQTPTPRLPATVRSADGRQVTVASAARILPLTGAISEVVFTLGLGGNVVGRDIAATFPQAADLPLVTRAHDVAVEGVLALRPTVILADPDTGPPEAMRQLRDSGVPVVIVEPAWSLPEVAPRIRAIARALGVEPAGEDLVRRTEDQIAAARARVPADAPRPRVAFLYMRGTAGVYLLGGKGSGADSMIEAAGAIDAGKAMGLDKAFSPITTEALIAARPDVILVMTKGLASVGGIDGLVKITGIAQTPAGRQRRIVDIEDGSLLSFGPRTAQALDLLVERLYRA
ncbi:heme/hemin ABC transporter substrate-binding protein [Acrocarpospora catenulata]|uniref:heme/hemin ABC transporter substrate-binding protein n=1 Tax=Acrocarpospora catenulata TaxID=2836182 RepID=UPI0027DED35A|nr:ABC transporter substrate-binding protein [Acrocarpospora catenulata]